MTSLGEPLDVQVQCDEVVDFPHLARGELGPDLVVASAAGDDLAPRLGGQRVVVGSGGVPAAAFGHVANARGDVVGQLKERMSRGLGASTCRAFQAMPWPTAG